jgi:hypothetical protein
MKFFYTQGINMKHTPLARGLLLSAIVAGALAQAPALAELSININMAPPAMLYEVRPTILPGYVWAPGYWAWHGDDYIWIRGRALTQRTGYRWEPDRWEHGPHGYVRQGGRWEREPQRAMHDDRGDGDGHGRWKKEKKSKHHGERND